jgi:hypothetical protein
MCPGLQWQERVFWETYLQDANHSGTCCNDCIPLENLVVEDIQTSILHNFQFHDIVNAVINYPAE